MNTNRYHVGLFVLGDLGRFLGIYDPSAPKCTPYFSLTTATMIAEAYRALPSEDGEPAREAEYDAAAYTFRFLDVVSCDWMEWEGEIIQGVRRYAIGHQEWTWKLVPIPRQDLAQR